MDMLTFSLPSEHPSLTGKRLANATAVIVDSPLSTKSFTMDNSSRVHPVRVCKNPNIATAKRSKLHIVRCKSDTDSVTTATTSTFPPSEIHCGSTLEPSVASNPAVQEHDEMSTDEQTHSDDWDDQFGDSPQNPGISLLASLDVWFLEGLEILQGEATGEGTSLAIIAAGGCSEQGLSLPDLVGEMGETLFAPLQTIEKLPVRRIDESKGSAYELAGEFGLALFSPLDSNFFELVEETEQVEEFELEEEDYTVDLQPEAESVLEACPRLLTMEMLKELTPQLPASVQMMRWVRAYSIERDGDSFRSMLKKCSGFKNTIVVIKSSKGDLLGGYGTSPWQSQDGQPRRFYGNGESFVFASNPADDAKPDDQKLRVFKWAGHNTYCQMCDVEKGQIAMGGGGGDFGWIVEDNFTIGETNHCDTFANPRLIASRDGSFDIIGFEVYGFKSLAEIYAAPFRKVSNTHRSLLDGVHIHGYQHTSGAAHR